ncbi:hypothetical protein F5Y15DRAFT_426601 [Xylariaceae sp. FL0016]|nr:hypothetical protein F5Y15DRAFT_426601 [Xylariaceae sp. FL0016]
MAESQYDGGNRERCVVVDIPETQRQTAGDIERPESALKNKTSRVQATAESDTAAPAPQRHPHSQIDTIPDNVWDEIRKVVKQEVHEANQSHNLDVTDLHDDSTTSHSEACLPSGSLRDNSLFPTHLRTQGVVRADDLRHRIGSGDVVSVHGSARSPMIYRRSSLKESSFCEWGQLFDENGHPTHRCAQVLKGLANHMIGNFPPQESLVVTPEKLATLYTRFSLDPEIFPFSEIFRCTSRDSYNHLSDFFADLQCEYHLVQPDPQSKPSVPALTPAGFAQYMMTCILAYPDEEARRLDKIAAVIPWFIVDDKSSSSTTTITTAHEDSQARRLPQQFVRSLLPVSYDLNSRQELISAIDDLMYSLELVASSSRPLDTTPRPLQPPPLAPAATSPARTSEAAILTPGATRAHASRQSYFTEALQAGADRYLPSSPGVAVTRPPAAGRRRFPPAAGALETIGDETVGGGGGGGSEDDAYFQPRGAERRGGVYHDRRDREAHFASSVDPRPSPSSLSSSSSSSREQQQGRRPQEYMRRANSYSHTLPPPPMGSGSGSGSVLTSSRRERSPQGRVGTAGGRASMPDVGSHDARGVSVPASHSAAITASTPTAASSGSGPGAEAPGTGRTAASLPVRRVSFQLDPPTPSGDAKTSLKRGTWGGPSGAGSEVVLLHGGSAGDRERDRDRDRDGDRDGNRERRHRRRRSSVASSSGRVEGRAPTWEEVLRSQKEKEKAGEGRDWGRHGNHG